MANPFDPSQGSYYNPDQLGYENVYLKETLHETGHVMGLNEPTDQQPGQSVMNNSSFCPKDRCADGTENIPTNITPCDNETVNLFYNDPRLPRRRLSRNTVSAPTAIVSSRVFIKVSTARPASATASLWTAAATSATARPSS